MQGSAATKGWLLVREMHTYQDLRPVLDQSPWYLLGVSQHLQDGSIYVGFEQVTMEGGTCDLGPGSALHIPEQESQWHQAVGVG